LQGLAPSLFKLSETPSGEVDVAGQNPGPLAALTSEFWRTHWNNSRIAANQRPGSSEAQTLYGGFDAMRTPHRYGFAIGLEIGPLPAQLLHAPDRPVYVLAGQDNLWELTFTPGQGVAWRMGSVVLQDPNFEPSQCNSIILTGYFEPKGHLTKRDPKSQIKLYSSGFLRDASIDIAYRPASDKELSSPTFVNFHGRAIFSNMMLSSFADSYAPRLLPQYLDLYMSMYHERKLSLADVRMLEAELCN